MFCAAEPELRSPRTLACSSASSLSVLVTLTAGSREAPTLLTTRASVTFFAPATRTRLPLNMVPPPRCTTHGTRASASEQSGGAGSSGAR